MAKPRKVVWTKGMFLLPQHFQAQDEFTEHALHFRSFISNFANWGFSRLAIDEASLVNGFFTLRHCEGILPDGLTFEAPSVDELPPGRQVDGVFANTRRPYLDIYLAIPQTRVSAANYQFTSDDAAGTFRFTAESRAAVDTTLGSDEKTIQVARKSLRLLFDSENLEGFTTCRLARILRSTAGTYVLSSEFIPPIVDIAASEFLLMLTRRQIEKIGATITARSLGRRRKNNDLADFSANEATDFWFLHTLNTHLPELVHVWKVRRGHPDVLYRIMLRLAGALTTFSLNDTVQNLPEYDHNELGESFMLLDERIRTLLDGFNTRERCIVTSLRPVEQFIWSGALDDERQLGASQVILSVSSQIAADELLSKFPRLVKVSNSDDLSRLIRSSLPGITMRHLATPPPSAQFNLNCHYFGLTTSGPLWENVLRTRSISVFVPGEIADPKLELLTLLD